MNRILFLVTVCVISLRSSQTMAQTFTTLHSFAGGSNGVSPIGELAISGDTLYGCAETGWPGDASARGSIFKIRSDGVGFSLLHVFRVNDFSTYNADGMTPVGGLLLSSDTLYGTASAGGTIGSGTVFAIKTNGTSFTVLHDFTAVSATSPQTNSDGRVPNGGLILCGDTLYGTAAFGGASGGGTLFAIKNDGTGFVVPHQFFHSNGIVPYSGLVLSGDTLYGNAGQGTSNSSGTVFSVKTNGTDFAALHVFSPLSGGFPRVNSDGAAPRARLLLAGDTLYGATGAGGAEGGGTIFAVNVNGSGYTTLRSFSTSQDFPNVNADGSYPVGLMISGDMLYGIAVEGGSSGKGTIFAVKTNGSAFATLYSFIGGNDGAYPRGGLVLVGQSLYGTAKEGGSAGFGTVFKLALADLGIVHSEKNIVLTWLTNFGAANLQSAPAVTATFTNIPGATSPYTNSISGVQQFFRLASP